MAQAAVHHGEHETSFWPLPTGLGILLVPIALTAYFAWQVKPVAVLLGGGALALLAIGLGGWVREFFTRGTDEGVGTIAVGAFIASEVVIFGTMFVAFWMGRIVYADQWAAWIPGNLNLRLALWLTFILWASSGTILMAERAMERGYKNASLSWLAVTFALGLLFVVLHMNEWRHLSEGGFALGSNIYATTFYSLTGVHTSHVVVGLAMQVFLIGAVATGLMTSARTTFFRASSLYWHFVDIMWLMVASNVYLVGGLR
ncbi:MAG: heme-copper oxidase subunit III [Nitrospirae bacterium]|nr:heme-copper oxidase subunit III [Nitrospirota bacterium]MBI3393503.1 heme-copper oxidase subunit III [Nitrospirota bacterium]